MKIKCPGCGKVLSIPEAAAGKIVKCPCGKQLRAPGGAKTPAAAAKPAGKQAASPPAKKPAAAARPPAKPAARPAQPPAAVAAPALDDDLFGELTENDLAPVRSVYSPGQKAPVDAGSPSAEGTGKSGGKSVVKIAFGSVLILLGAVGLVAYFMGAFDSDSDDGGSIRIRRRSPIGICIGVIITGFGWAAAGFRGGSGDDE